MGYKTLAIIAAAVATANEWSEFAGTWREQGFCGKALGLEQSLDNSAFSASDHHKSSLSGGGVDGWNPHRGRLNNQGKFDAWMTMKADQKQWLQIDFPKMQIVTAIATQGASRYFLWARLHQRIHRRILRRWKRMEHSNG